MKKATVAILALIIIWLWIWQVSNEKKDIYDKINSMNGTVVSIDRTIFSNGPFLFKGKDHRVYKITYTIDGQTKVIWMKTGLFKNSWAE